MENSRVVWPNTQSEMPQTIFAFIPLGHRDGQDRWRLQTGQNTLFEYGITGQFYKPHGIGDFSPFVQLGNDDPRVIKYRMWDDVWIHRPLVPKVDLKEFLISCRHREYLMMCFLDIVGVLEGERVGMSSKASWWGPA